MSGRWWLAPLLLAAVVDAAVVVHHELAPATVINRAVQRGTRSGQCREAVLLQTNGASELDVVDAWVAKGLIYTQKGAVMLASASTLAPASVRAIELGEDLGPVTSSPAGSPATLASWYQAQVAKGVSWLNGPCVPMVNPFQSGMRRLGLFAVAHQDYAFFAGHITVDRGGGQPLIPDAAVWIATGSDGRIAFQVLRATDPVPAGQLRTVVAFYTYPRQRMANLERHETVRQIEAFYTGIYRHIEAALQATQAPTGSV